jgi:hypothetical protein
MFRLKFSKILIALILTTLIISSISIIWAQTIKPLEVKYPDLPGKEGPKSLRTFLPNYIEYIYRFFIISGGIVALIALITGGFRYLTSAGNPSLMQDSRNQIFAGLLGLIVVLGSYVVLN